MPSPRRALLAAAALAALVGALVALGRWESDRAAHAEVQRMERIRALVGPRLDAPTLSNFRLEPELGFDCLIYRVGTNEYGLELCIDKSGRLIEALDRRFGEPPRVGTLRYDHEASPIRVDRAEVDRLLKRLAVTRR